MNDTTNEATRATHGSVLHLIDTGGPGGAETVFIQLAQRLRGGGLDLITVVPREDWLSNGLRSCGMQPVILNSRGSFNKPYVKALISLVRTRNVRLIHTHLLGSAVYGALVGLFTRTPVIAVMHGPTDVRAPGSLAFVKRWLLKRCDALVAVSTSTREALVDFGIPPGKITLIRNGVDTSIYAPGRADDLRAELGLGPEDLLIGAVGNIRAPKAYEVLLRAAQSVLERCPKAFFVIVGEGSEAALQPLAQLCAQLNISARVRFVGFRKSRAELYWNFDVFVSSSRSEGLSLAFLEAMATGRAIVATRSGGPQEALVSGESGVLVPTEDPQSLAVALLEVLADAQLRARLAVAARKHVVANFSLEATVREYEVLYRRLAGKP
jgi:glycosyltransferase involved in cell wall biosynthesis